MLTTAVKEIGYEDVKWIHVAMNWVWCRVLYKTKQLSSFDRLRETLSASKQFKRQGKTSYCLVSEVVDDMCQCSQRILK